MIKIVKGAFQVHYFRTEKKLYKLTNQTDREKTIYIEHPVRKGWGLSDDSPKPEIVTDRYYRFRVVLQPYASADLAVTERQGLMDSYSLLNLSRDQLGLFVQRRYIDEPTRVRLEQIINLRVQMAEIESKIEAFDDEVERIEADQKRLRENIESLSKTPDAKPLIARYIAKAGEQETRLEEMEKQRKSMEADKLRLENELAAAIKAFEVK
jgi:hypothetical protein